MSDIDNDGNEEEKQDDKNEGMVLTLLGVGNAVQSNLDREENEPIEQEDFVGVEGGEDDEEEEGELVEGEVDDLAVPAGAKTLETDTWNDPDGSVRALTEDERVVMGLIREVFGNGNGKRCQL